MFFRDAPRCGASCWPNLRLYFGDFFAGKISAFLLGFLRKTSGRTWCFDGECVVLCVVNVVV